MGFKASPHRGDQPRGSPGSTAGAILPVVAWVFGAAVFYRDQLTSRFDKIMGNDGDARLVVLLHEHWFAVLRGHRSWTDPNFFYPAKDVLGYTDTFFLNALLYIPLRAARLDPFLAFQWTLIGLSAIGFGALYLLLRRYLGARPAFAAGGCLLYYFANNMFIKVGHPQLLTSWWTPVCALAGAVALQHRSAWVRAASAAACGALASLIVYSSFYVGWTTLLAAGLIGLLLCVPRPMAVVAFVRARPRELIAAAGGGLVGAIPFALIYLPILQRTGGRSYEEVQLYAPRPGDLLNVSPSNYLWGSALRRLFGADDPRLHNGELFLAVTPLLWLFAVGLTILVVVIGRQGRRSPSDRGRDRAGRSTDAGRHFAFCALAAAVSLAVLPLNIEGHSLWHPFWAHVPGASALRAINRMQIVTSQLVSVSFAILLSRALDLAGARRLQPSVAYRLSAFALLALALIEQVNLTPSSTVDRSDELTKLEGVPAAPSSCSSFFVTSPGPPVSYFILEIDAMLVADRIRLPTVNGYSGHTPEGWMLANPQDPGYLDAVRTWSQLTSMPAGLCGYELTTKTWDPTPFGAAPE